METLNFASHLDFANHHQSATHKDITELCEKVLKYKFNSAFVNPFYVKYAKVLVKNLARVGTVVSFPLGQEVLETKISSALRAVEDGADEIDVCLNVGLIKEGDWGQVQSEMQAVLKAVKRLRPSMVVKFIPEAGLLTDEEIKKVAGIMVEAGADFFKTSTGGAGSAGSTIEQVKLIRESVGDKIKIKVVGGIATFEQAKLFIDAGADRIGTSHAVEIIEGKEGSAHSATLE